MAMTEARAISDGRVDLKALIEAAKKATPGPWRAEERSGGVFIIGHPTWGCARFGVKGEWNVAQIDEYDDCDANATFIALANPSTIAALVTEVLAMREAAKPFADAIARYTAHYDAETGNQPREDDSEKIEFMGWLGSYFPLVTLGDFRKIAQALGATDAR